MDSAGDGPGRSQYRYSYQDLQIHSFMRRSAGCITTGQDRRKESNPIEIRIHDCFTHRSFFQAPFRVLRLLPPFTFRSSLGVGSEGGTAGGCRNAATETSLRFKDRIRRSQFAPRDLAEYASSGASRSGSGRDRVCEGDDAFRLLARFGCVSTGIGGGIGGRDEEGNGLIAQR